MRSIVAGVLVVLVAPLLGTPAAAEPDAATVLVRQELSEAVREGGAPVSAIVVLDEAANLAPLAGDHDAVVAELKRVAERTQPAVRAALPAGVNVRGSLWITNALVVELPETGAATALGALSRVPGVAELALNSTVRSVRDTAAAEGLTVGDHTWGIDRVRADRVWDELGVDGAGVRVAVLDTGVDMRHPDLAGRMVTDDPADPTYPGGWIWFDGNGNPGRTRPSDDDGHGTHVSGTIVGGASSGTAIGVAPGARLMHAQVLPGGEGTWAQVLGGMQWSIAPFTWDGTPAGAPANVVNMSIGVRGYLPETVDVAKAIRASGAFPSFSIGNECEPGGTTSPGNVFDAFGVGATGRDETVPWWSCGGVVSRRSWSGAPADWPESYVKPDVTAPGDAVLSAAPGGGYETRSGTSMATPHVTGVVALMRSAVPGLTVEDAMAALRDTAVFTEAHGAARPNERIGAGRIDGFAAVRAVAGASAASGTVTSGGRGVPGASVSNAATGQVTTTDERGRYRLPLSAGRHTLTVSASTYEDRSVRVTVPADGVGEADVRLAGTAAGAISGTVTFDGRGVPGATVTVLGGPRVVTGQDGRYRVDRVPPGRHVMLVSSAGLPGSDPVSVTVTDRRTAAVAVELRSPALVERTSVGVSGEDSDSSSGRPDMSADGRFVAFDSYAGNIVAGDVNGQQDVFVRDRRTGVTGLVSVASDGTQGDRFSSNPSVSGDGRFVAFESSASNLVAGDSGTSGDVFLHDRETGSTVRLSQTPAGATPNGMSSDPVVSADGRFVAFSSWASDLVAGDVNGVGDVFVYDVAAGTLALGSLGAGGQSDRYAQTPDLSGDGRFLVFASGATNLVAGDENGWTDVFVRDLVAGTTSLVSVASDGTQGDHEAQSPSISEDGNVVAFHGLMSNLASGDTNGTYDVFAHDRRDGRTVLVSAGALGEAGDGSSVGGSVSADGRHVGFSSGAPNLVDGDVNGATDVFVRDLVEGTTSLVLDGADGDSIEPVVGAGGRMVALHSSASNLVAGDGNRTMDAFVVDRFPAAERAARFVLSELAVDRAGDEVTVRARVTNIGAVKGSHDVPLTVDGVAREVRSVSLASGAATEVRWVVPAGSVGGHDVRVGDMAASYRVRPPVVRVAVSAVHGGRPLPGATVRFVDDGSARPGGVTGRDGVAVVETQTGSGEYTMVVTRAATRSEPGYLLVKRVRVERDVSVSLGRGSVTEADLSVDQVSENHETWTYLRHSEVDGVGFAFPTGRLVVSTGVYSVRHLHVVAGFERSWLAVSDTRSVDFSKRGRLRYGGKARAELTASPEGVTWAVTDAHGIPFSVMARTPLRGSGTTVGITPPATYALDDLTRLSWLAGEPEEIVLRVYDTEGTQVRGGGVDWAQRQVPLTDLPAGDYRVDLTVSTGGYPPGSVSATTQFPRP